jgi:hypothetical protein
MWPIKQQNCVQISGSGISIFFRPLRSPNSTSTLEQHDAITENQANFPAYQPSAGRPGERQLWQESGRTRCRSTWRERPLAAGQGLLVHEGVFFSFRTASAWWWLQAHACGVQEVGAAGAKSTSQLIGSRLQLCRNMSCRKRGLVCYHTEWFVKLLFSEVMLNRT